MRRVAQLIQLNPNDEAAYIRYHHHVWPTVLATIADCNIRNYSIFLRNGLLFSYFEYHGDNYEQDMIKMAACPETQRWWSITNSMQTRMPDAEPEEKWSEMQEVFHFNPAVNPGRDSD